MATGPAKKSPKGGIGGLVTAPPISAIKALRSLEKEYVRVGLELEKAVAEINRLTKALQKAKAT